ncbi:hypothetical protein SBADM41S_02459 [Streptomyces badius]
MMRVLPPTSSGDATCHREMSKHWEAVCVTTSPGSSSMSSSFMKRWLSIPACSHMAPLGSPGRSGREVDVGQPVGGELDAQVPVEGCPAASISSMRSRAQGRSPVRTASETDASLPVLERANEQPARPSWVPIRSAGKSGRTGR